MTKIHVPGVSVKQTAPAGPVGTPITEATTINTSGDYYVANDFSATGAAIRINADNVTIDLNWKTITGNTGNNADMDVIGPESGNSLGHDNITIKNGYIVHGATTETSFCRGIGIKGSNWTIEYCAIRDDANDGTQNSPSFPFACIGISRKNGYWFENADNPIIRYNYLQSIAEGGTAAQCSCGIYIFDNGADYMEIHHNIIAECHRSIYLPNWNAPGAPTTNSKIYQNQLSPNLVADPKAPYGILFSKSRYFDIYYNRISAWNGRGIILDGSEANDPGPYWADNNEINHNAIGCQMWNPTKGVGPVTYPGVYGIRIRFNSRNNDVHDNNIIVTNIDLNAATQGAYGINVGTGDSGMPGLNFDDNIVVAKLDNTGALNVPFHWEPDCTTDVSNNQWWNDDTPYIDAGTGVDGMEIFKWTSGEDFGLDQRTASSNDDGPYSTQYSPGSSTPAQVTGLTLRRFFDSYVLEWDESAEADVWRYQVYKDDVAIAHPVMAARSPHASVPKPFHVDINETGTVEYKVAALTLTGTEGTKSVGVSTTSAANGWQ